MKFKLIFFSLFFTLATFGQNVKDGETFFNNKQYTKAKAVYENLLKKRPNDALYNYSYARCCYELKEFEPAIEHFEMTRAKYSLRDLYLGDLYFNTYHFDKSKLAYESYISTLKPDDKRLLDLKQKVNKAEMASRLLNKVEDIAIVDSAVVDKNDFLRFYKFSKELGMLSQTLLKLKNHQLVDKIVYTTQRKDRVYFSDTIQGQMDIFTSFKLLDSVSMPVSVSKEINTEANENYPFLLLDGITLYFASDGENSIGGYDLFITRYTPATNSFLKPENIGMPFNSPANDYMMVVDEQRKLGWFATDRHQPAGKVMIYTFVPNKFKIIIRSEDEDSLRAAAQLKTYRKISKSLTDSTATNSVQTQESDNQIEFEINDSVVYTNAKQFKSVEAIKLWIKLRTMTVSLNSKQLELEKLRQKYNNIEKQEERDSLSTNIINLEKNCIEIEKQISSIKIEVRTTENNFLQKKL